jgi:hypothetical protein
MNWHYVAIGSIQLLHLKGTTLVTNSLIAIKQDFPWVSHL